MILDNIVKLKIELIINDNLLKNNIIDNKTYDIVNSSLLKMIEKERHHNELL